MNMVKRFLEITVNFDGNQIDIKESNNHKLFAENNLNIYKEHYLFFQNHFGSYPVIHIDYRPMSVTTNYTCMMKQFREIILNTFEPYEYLMECTGIWENETLRNRFMRYCQYYGNVSLTETEIRTSFTLLSKLLFKRFNKKVFVLIDEFDALVDSPYLKDSPEKDKIIDFIYTVNYRLLKCNKFVYRAFVTGQVRQENIRLPTDKVLPRSVKEYNCKEYNTFSEFYGVTPAELDFLLTRFYSKNYIREKVKNCIFVKLTEIEQRMQIYSLWTVLRYLANFNTTTECLPY